MGGDGLKGVGDIVTVFLGIVKSQNFIYNPLYGSLKYLVLGSKWPMMLGL